MAVPQGTHLGPYEILAPIGAGGMGEVYRARDTRLGREVAIKLLPADLSSNQDRLSRFEQEARSSSALNHPNIITVYDIGTADGHSYIAMELVDGRTLRETLETGPLPLRRVIAIATQIAEGLSKAHSEGIVHRDLKPENLMISKDGFLKILDFGLAKSAPLSKEGASGLATIAKTDAGTILGTVGYMSPEQASGKVVDFHSDQFSFGSILYEMIAGKRAFERATAAQTLSAIIQDDPAPLATPGLRTPVPIRWIVERCLAKDPEERYASTRDLARELRSVQDHFSDLSTSNVQVGASTAPRSIHWLRIWSLASLFIIAALLLELRSSRLRQQEPPVLRTLTFSGHDHSPAASPDGKIIAFTSVRDGTPRIWLKQLVGGGEVALTGGPDDRARFSPDGSTLLFTHSEGLNNSLYRIALLGGEPHKILDDADSGDWSPDGKQLAFVRSNQTANGSVDSSLWIADVTGENPRELVAVKDKALFTPRWSPDGRKIAVTENVLRNISNSAFWITIDGKEKHPIAPPLSFGTLSSMAWSGSGDELVFSELEALVTFSGLSSGRVYRANAISGETRTLFWTQNLYGGDPYMQSSWTGTFDIAAPGRVVFDSISSRQNLGEFDLQGQPNAINLRWLTRGNSSDRQPAYSPDGEWVIFSSTRSGNLDLWKLSTKTGTVIRLTDDAAQDWDPTFSRDGKSILWSSNRSGHFEIWSADADGSQPHVVTKDGNDAENPTETPDRQWIVYNSYNPEKLGVWKIKKGSSAIAVQLFSGSTQYPEVSPDGKFVAVSSADGFIRVIGIDSTRAPQQIPLKGKTGVAGRDRWLSNGRIAFIDIDEKGTPGLYVQDFVPGQETTSTRRLLIGASPDLQPESFGVSPDGSRLTISSYETFSSLVLADNVSDVSPPRQK